MCGQHFINKYTPPGGIVCPAVLVMEEVDFIDQYFISLTIDRKTWNPIFTYSKYGGKTIERLLRERPESVKTLQIDYAQGINLFAMKKIAEDLGCKNKASTLSFILKNIYECFIQRDCLSITINPLALTPKYDFRGIHCRIEIDDSAVYR